jgi:thiamine-monophosphate kinase
MPAATDSLQPLSLDPGCDLVIALDTLVDGVHFPVATAPADVGFKALAVNLSDLAAMGATPLAARASVTHPDHGGDDARRWLAAFEEGLGALAQRLGVDAARPLITRGPLCVTVEALGSVPRGMALGRGGAACGDRILVTGTLGDAGLALAADSAAMGQQNRAFLHTRLARPEPRVAAGIALRGLASAAIDISDGLVADLGHILTASHRGARLMVDDLPLSRVLAEELPRERAWQLALSSGDDYELCFTVAPDSLAAVDSRLQNLECRVTPIGTVTAAETGLRCLLADGSCLAPAPGYRHFP